MIVVGFDFSKDKIVLVAQSKGDYNSIRGQRELGDIGCCEVRESVFEIDPKYVYELNNILSNNLKDVVAVDDSFKEWRAKSSAENPILIKCDVVTSRIYPGKVKLPHQAIEEATRYFFKPAVNMPKYKEGKWDGYINLYRRWEKSFLTGLLSNVCEVLDKEGIPYVVEYTYDTKPKRQFNWVVDDGINPDIDQLEAVEAAIEGKRGIIKAPTGFGKLIA